MTGEARRNRDSRIVAMLADGLPVDVIVEETGASRATIFRRRAVAVAGDRAAPVEAAGPAVNSAPPVAPVEAVPVGGPVETATAAYLAGLSPLAIAAALGVDAYALDVDRPDFGLSDVAISRRRLERLAARADTLERMRRSRPAQWAAWVAHQDDAERAAALDSRLRRETWVEFFREIVSHQSLLLIERDFRDWIEWVKELTVARYPTMAE